MKFTKNKASSFSKVMALLAVFTGLSGCSSANLGSSETGAKVKVVPVAEGWANNSVNVVAFRKNSLVTFQDTQYIAWYNANQNVVLAKRKHGATNWQLQKTNFKGNAADAHNTISIMVDGAGYLHLSWDHHNNKLNYARSVSPGSLQMSEKMPMTGQHEKAVSYPEFYRLPSGNLMFFYRDGGSGRGNMVINRYDTTTQKWTQLHSNLISGEGKRNAYWQAYVDKKGTIQVSWVWRESPDVASNHDLAYARSLDGGETWQKSTGEQYALPITHATAEVAWAVPQKSELINQTSMAADDQGNPFIATYWRAAASSIPQYQLVYLTPVGWKHKAIDFRKTPFSLSGAGTKRIPIARPQVLVKGSGPNAQVVLVFRDLERDSRASAVLINKISAPQWTIVDLTPNSLGSWEPTYDTELWKAKEQLHLFVQKVEQVDAEGQANLPPQPIQVIEWKPTFGKK